MNNWQDVRNALARRSRWLALAAGGFGALAVVPAASPAAQCGLVGGGTAAGSVTAEQVVERRLEGRMGAKQGSVAPIDEADYDNLQVATFGLG